MILNMPETFKEIYHKQAIVHKVLLYDDALSKHISYLESINLINC